MRKLFNRVNMTKSFFEISNAKATNKLTINTLMMSSVFLIFTLIWSLNPNKFSAIIVGQLIMSIPLLFASTLAYTKIAFCKNNEPWDAFGWFTNTVANALLLNVIGLMVNQIFPHLALYYFILLLALMTIYSAINIKYNEKETREKIFKFLFFVIILIYGGILQII